MVPDKCPCVSLKYLKDPGSLLHAPGCQHTKFGKYRFTCLTTTDVVPTPCVFEHKETRNILSILKIIFKNQNNIQTKL